MSRLSKLLAQPKEVEICGDMFNIYPLTVKHLGLFTNLEDPEKQGAALKEIVQLTLKRAVPEATQEELDNISVEHLEAISDAIFEVNGLKDEKTKLVKERLAQQRELKKTA